MTCSIGSGQPQSMVSHMRSTYKFYGSADVDACRKRGHHFTTAWSDKTPLKVSLICQTCSNQQGRSVYLAYGSDVGSYGGWRKSVRSSEPSVASPDSELETPDSE